MADMMICPNAESCIERPCYHDKTHIRLKECAYDLERAGMCPACIPVPSPSEKLVKEVSERRKEPLRILREELGTATYQFQGVAPSPSSEPVNYRKLDVMALEESAYRGDDSAKAELIRRGFNSHDCGALADTELVDPQPDLQQLEDDIGFELCGEIECNQECGGYLFCDKIDTLVQKILRFVSASQQAKCAECKKGGR